MKYFKHELLTRDDDRIWELIDTHGVQGYGLWWIILEELYKAEDDGFQIDATETWFKRLGKELNLTDWRTLLRTLDTFAQLGLIDAQLWAEHVIYAPGIAKRADSYIKQKEDARERKRRQREREKAEMSRVTHAGQAECHAPVTTNTDPDPDPDPDTNLKPEEIHTCDLDLKNGVEILGTEPRPEPEPAPTQPDESGQSSQALATQQKTLSKAKSSAAAIAAEFQEIYNQNRPDTWAECKTLNSKRSKGIGLMVKECSGLEHDWAEVLRIVLAMCKVDKFLSTEYSNGGIDALFLTWKNATAPNWLRLYETGLRQGINPSAVHESGMTAADIQKAKKDFEFDQAWKAMGYEPW